MTYTAAFAGASAANGAVQTIDYPSVIRNVNWQFNPGTRTTWDAIVQGRLSPAHAWVPLKVIDDDVDATDLLFETLPFPQMRVVVGILSGGSGNVTMHYQSAPPPAQYVTAMTAQSEVLTAPTVLFAGSANANGAAVPVANAELLDHVAVQISPGSNTEWTVNLQARLDATADWVTLETVAHGDTDGPASGPRFALTLPGFPFYRAVLAALQSDPAPSAFAVDISYEAIVATGLMSSSTPTSEISHLT